MKRIRICFFCLKPVYIFDSAYSPNGNKNNFFVIHPGCKAALEMGSIPRKVQPEPINYIIPAHMLMLGSILEEDVL